MVADVENHFDTSEFKPCVLDLELLESPVMDPGAQRLARGPLSFILTGRKNHNCNNNNIGGWILGELLYDDMLLDN